MVRWFIAVLLGIGAGCAGPLPGGQHPVKHSGALAEDLDCSVYQVDDGMLDAFFRIWHLRDPR